jgi:hypothetical protein
MKARPILFNAPMVRALLDGTKTQTRRLVKPQPEKVHDGEPYWYIGGYRAWGHRPAPAVPLRVGGNPLPCPYGQAGDQLWVRETWAYGIHALAAARDEDGPFVYAADSHSTQGRLCDRWRPSIHMLRAASRITLEVTEVRVERLQDISGADCQAEGIESYALNGKPPIKGAGSLHLPATYYRYLWESINGPGSWDANPWVWAVSFKRLPA